jgi:hypothetical protein
MQPLPSWRSKNIFDNGANADLVIRDQDNGGGTGVLNVSNPTDAEHAFVQSLYSKLLGRAGDTATGGEVDQWVSKLSTMGNRGVAKAILFSDESLGRLVNDLYAKLSGPRCKRRRTDKIHETT